MLFDVRRLAHTVKKTTVIASIFLGFVLLWIFAVPQFPKGSCAEFVTAMSEARQVGLAALLYSEDHQDRLPENLHQLVPKHIPTDKYFTRMYLMTPRLILKDLPTNTTIVIKLVTDNSTKVTRVIMIHADMTTDFSRP